MRDFVLGLLLSGLGTSGIWVLADPSLHPGGRIVGGVLAAISFIICICYADGASNDD